MLGVSQVLAELNNNLDFMKGSMGVMLPRLAPRSVDPATYFYYLFLIAAACTLVIAFAIKVGRIGYGLIAIREDEDTARMLGVPTERPGHDVRACRAHRHVWRHLCVEPGASPPAQSIAPISA